MEKLIAFATENWDLILPILIAIYELVIRIKPTLKSKSLFNWLAILFDTIIPNLKKGGGTFNLSNKENEKKTN